ncbi:hypothetical protein DENSPDRAFT_787389, partial [Dentipellis sp. KUC8613]
RDEDFDASYEALISLASTLGDVKPRCTPEHVISSLTTGTYQEWANADSDQRCPICLDDYTPTDAVTKLSDCPHWLHSECLEVSLHKPHATRSTTNVSFVVSSNGCAARRPVPSAATTFAGPGASPRGPLPQARARALAPAQARGQDPRARAAHGRCRASISALCPPLTLTWTRKRRKRCHFQNGGSTDSGVHFGRI